MASKIKGKAGRTNDINIYENYAQIRFRDKGVYDVFIEFGEAFKEQNLTAFQCLNSIKKYINYVLGKKEDIYCICVGLVQKRKDKVVVEVYKELEFEIEDEMITQFINNNKDILSIL